MRRKILLAHIFVEEQQASLFFRELRIQVFAPHEQETRRIIAQARFLRAEIGQQPRDIFPFDLFELHKTSRL